MGFATPPNRLRPSRLKASIGKRRAGADLVPVEGCPILVLTVPVRFACVSLVSKPAIDDPAVIEAAPDPSEFPRPSLTADVVVLTVESARLKALVYRRAPDAGAEPNKWALPGGFVNFWEDIEEVSTRVVGEKAYLDVPHRFRHAHFHHRFVRRGEERGWVVTTVETTLLPAEMLRPHVDRHEDLSLACVRLALDDETVEAEIDVEKAPGVSLAFDHAELIAHALRFLRPLARGSGLTLDFMPECFTLRELQLAQEALLGVQLNRPAFRRHVTETLRIVEPTGEVQAGVGHRPPELYRRRDGT